MPARSHAWPNKAACWSPRIAVMGISAANKPDAVTAKSPLEGTISGNMAMGMSHAAHNSSSHLPVWMFISKVREAFEASMMWRLPRVNCHTSHVSTVPNSNSPASAMARAAGTWFSSHTNLLALKYGSRRKPVRSCTIAAMCACASHHVWVRLSCHTKAGAMGLPVCLCHTTVVSR